MSNSQPYDPKYHTENQIKHLSFNAYLRKLLAGRPPSAATSSSVDLPPLDPLSLSVITPCPSGTHPPFPEGICSKCQPSALTLQSQPFRMVDHVEFATPNLIDSILTAWRKTGNQRFAFLIGHYDRYDKVPMGVKAVVEAVWEPKQEGEVDGLTIEVPWSDEKQVAQVADWCEKGLGVVGMIYTDLTPDPDDITKTQYKRHAQSFTASALEMLTSAKYQVLHPLATRASPTGQFSSRFVTCCLTGTEDGNIDVVAWQASEHGEAMVKANAVEASVDPGTVRVRKPSDGEYIPEVFYSFKNEYGIQVKMPAKPTFPVEYLFVNVSCFSCYRANPRLRMDSRCRRTRCSSPSRSRSRTAPGSATRAWSSSCASFSASCAARTSRSATSEPGPRASGRTCSAGSATGTSSPSSPCTARSPRRRPRRSRTPRRRTSTLSTRARSRSSSALAGGRRSSPSLSQAAVLWTRTTASPRWASRAPSARARVCRPPLPAVAGRQRLRRVDPRRARTARSSTSPETRIAMCVAFPSAVRC